MRRASLVSIASFLLACGFVECAPSQPQAASSIAEAPDLGVSLEVFAKGLKEPVAFAWAPGDPKRRVFVAEKKGRLAALDSSGRIVARILDVSDLVSTGSEQGLLGIAFHPKWS